MVLGTYKEIVLGRSTDKEIQKIAQDGGIVTALFSYALDEKLIDGAVVAGPANELWKPEAMVAMSSDEILAAAGTKYTFSPNIWMLKKAVRQYGLEKVGTVAIPCQTMGIRKMQSYPFGVRFLADKIALRTGIFCMENFPFASLETFITSKMGITLNLLRKWTLEKVNSGFTPQMKHLQSHSKKPTVTNRADVKFVLTMVSELSDISTGSVGSGDRWSAIQPVQILVKLYLKQPSKQE